MFQIGDGQQGSGAAGPRGSETQGMSSICPFWSRLGLRSYNSVRVTLTNEYSGETGGLFFFLLGIGS